MQQNDLMDILVLMKKQYGKLCEVFDLTEQLAGALDRRDQVSVQLLVAMRQEPIDALRQIEQSLQSKRESLSGADATHLVALQSGASPQGELEQLLAEQASSNQRQFERLMALDRRVNHNLGGKDSVYAE